MKHFIQRHLPDQHTLASNRWLAPFAGTLGHPRLWHLNRRSAAGAVAVGLFCGLIPGPLQMAGAALASVSLRVNLPLALLTTLYTNPFTIVPLYAVAYTLGQMLTGASMEGFAPPPALAGLGASIWLRELLAWIVDMGRPLALGLPTLATLLALGGYLLTHAAWRLHVLIRWHRRAARRRG